MEIKLWVLGGLLAVILPLATWAVKLMVGSIIKELKGIATELISIRLGLSANSQDLHHMKDQVADHETRIRTLERKP